MRIHPLIRLAACALILLATALSAGLGASAHPEDEMCAPGSDMDPELCRALAQIDNAEAPLTAEALLINTDRTLLGNTAFFVRAGIGHILPGGLDHILFVLALFFAVRKFGPLALQISIFTLAHSASLALAAAGFVNVPGEVVEPLIAASIAFVALENIFFRSITAWRPFIIFGFGLLHGLGFAGFFLEQDLPNGLFWSSLIGFNIGVELGQLSVVLLAWLALNWFFKARWYRAVIVIPASLLIAGIGLWWAVERVAGAF
tara:strand:+ start:5529 stop:6308 length:780 start_codon:yes stop_codon:yes gene_type:complete